MRRTSFRPVRALFVASLPAAAAVAVACSDDTATTELGPPGDGGSAPLLQDARATGNDGGSGVSTMRFAHLAPGIGPVDFCYRSALGGTAVGPVLGGGVRVDAAADDAGDDAEPPAAPEPPGAPEPEPDEPDAGAPDAADDDAGPPTRSARYRTVSKYFNLEASGPITFTVVTAGSTSCAGPLARADVTLDPGKLSTVVLFGRPADGGPGLELAAFTDDRRTEADKARVRVIHAALGRDDQPGLGPIAVSAVGAPDVALAGRVEPRRAAAPELATGVDDLGYVTAEPLPDPAAIVVVPLAADAGDRAWVSADAELALRGASLHTAFVLGARGDDDAGTSPWLEVLWCADTTTSGDQTSCQRLR